MSTNDPVQKAMIRDAMQAIAQRKPGRSKLVYDKTKRTIVAVAEGSNVPQALNITAEDADMFGVLTISSDWLRNNWSLLMSQGALPLNFSKWDDGDALTQSELCIQPSAEKANGILSLHEAKPGPSETAIVLQKADGDTGKPDRFRAPDGALYRAATMSGSGQPDASAEVIFADVKPQLELRRAGIFETTILKDKTVLCIGLGTGGAHIAVELAKCGVGCFLLVDGDRLSVGNVVRHPGGISQVGRSKVNVVRDLILEKNPGAQVEVRAVELSYDNKDAIAALVCDSDLVVCGTDNRPSKLLVNELCVAAKIPALYGGAFRRAYGGQIVRVRPKQSICYQCFVAAMPEEASDVEVSSEAAASDIAYSDRPVAVEPGLSLDVLPIATMVAKLALVELVADKSSTLNALRKDFEAPWYRWFNRPEPDTPAATMPPLSESVDEMTINRWYGVYIDRNESCPVCGDFVGTLAAAYGLDPAKLPALPEKE